jgi:hypothetical protein
MVNQFGNKPEIVSGRLLQFYGVWKVQSGYGTFPLVESLQSKPDVSSNGSWVSATIERGVVSAYHFQEESL